SRLRIKNKVLGIVYNKTYLFWIYISSDTYRDPSLLPMHIHGIRRTIIEQIKNRSKGAPG
ncbi:hypothetical protein, partial [Salmonella sp. s51944]|uniref:hypothetical protein n=1 Tax=Salmonella sp. s51944 TaxID=3159655 RepID=UPI00397FA570